MDKLQELATAIAAEVRDKKSELTALEVRCGAMRSALKDLEDKCEERKSELVRLNGEADYVRLAKNYTRTIHEILRFEK